MKSIKADNKETRGVFIINFEYIEHNNSVFLLLFLNMLLHFRKDFSHFIFLTKRKKRKIYRFCSMFLLQRRVQEPGQTSEMRHLGSEYASVLYTTA